MAHNLARNNLRTFSRSTISRMSPAAPILQPVMVRQKVQSRLCCPTPLPWAERSPAELLMGRQRGTDTPMALS